MAVPNAAAGVNALLDREAQTRSSASRFGPPSPIKSLNHGSFGQPCERALHAAAAFRGEMHQQPDLWFRERYARHLKEATAWMEAYLKVRLSCGSLIMYVLISGPLRIRRSESIIRTGTVCCKISVARCYCSAAMLCNCSSPCHDRFPSRTAA